MVKRKNRDRCISTWAMATALMLATTAQAQTARNSAAVNDTTATDSITTKEKELGEVRVTGMIRRNTEAAVIAVAKESELVLSNISAQEIRKTQDNNAGEVIRRVPGVSLIEDKFVMVRGLSQRYNNVWINGGAVPSSEADSRAFSFDIIPGSQIDNLVIVKSPSPEFPADFTGGFIQLNTKAIPSSNMFQVSVGGNINDATHFSNLQHADKGNGNFDNADPKTQWLVKNKKPVSDLKLGADWAAHCYWGEHKLGMVGAVNYTHEYRTYSDMQNNLFGIYDVSNDQRNYLRRSTDQQYNVNNRIGALLNLTFLSGNGNHKLELKNILNLLSNNRYTWREGLSAQSDLEQSAEYLNRTRTTYNVQLTGHHTLHRHNLEWSGSYAFANRNMPDRRRYLVNDANTPGVMELERTNDLKREYTKLNEHIVSANINDKIELGWGKTAIKTGVYGEYRTRKYTTRQLYYQINPADNDLPQDFRSISIPNLLGNDNLLGNRGLYLLEDPHMRNNYKGNNKLGAAYAALSLPIGKLNVYAGVRYEFNEMELISNMRDYEVSEKSRFYRSSDLFPSINTTYKFNDKHQMRLSYGKSVNRPEFREVSTSVYYDFDLASSVMGNADLKTCYVHNVDVRYEWYPSSGEQITLAAFYKRFENPIEWTYTVSGGTDYIYSFENAKSANNYGLELDIRKDLSFIGLRGFSWSFNGSLIHSRVKFADGSRFANRPMQGQSPYLINTGLFYRHPALRLNVALLYNRIGKRIIGVGRSEGSTGSEDNARIPDSYEMPRNTVDLTMSKNLGEHWEIRAAVKDLLAEKVSYKQFADVAMPNGTSKEVEQITREYRPGRNFSLMVSYRF